MPRHYLLSFLGTGQYDTHGNTRRYREATYRLPDGRLQTSPFVAEALWRAGEYDGIVLIGTMGSMWEEAYLRFAGADADDATATALFERAGAATADTPLADDWVDAVRAALPGESYVAVLEYGLTPESLARNVPRLGDALAVLPKGAHLALDITHGFRSQPFVAIAALQAASVRRDAPYRLRHIRYGMLETLRTRDHASVVALDAVLELEQLARAAYVAQTYGRFGEMAEVFGDAHALTRPLRRLDEALSMQRVLAATEALERLRGAVDAPDDPRVQPLTWVLRSLLDGLSASPTGGQLQFAFARWYHRQRQYAAAVIFLQEAIVTRVVERDSLGVPTARGPRERAGAELMKANGTEANRRYRRLRPIRNDLAHAVMDSRRNPDNDIAYLGESLRALGPFFVP